LFLLFSVHVANWWVVKVVFFYPPVNRRVAEWLALVRSPIVGRPGWYSWPS